MSRASRRRAFCEARRLAGMVPASVAAPRRVHGALKRETRSASVSRVEGWFVAAKRRGQGGRREERRRGKAARARAREISSDFNISSRPRRAEQRRCLIILITMPRSLDCAAGRGAGGGGGSSFNELGPLISAPKFLIIFPPLLSGATRGRATGGREEGEGSRLSRRVPPLLLDTASRERLRDLRGEKLPCSVFAWAHRASRVDANASRSLELVTLKGAISSKTR